MSYADEQAKVGRQPIVVCELDLDKCAYEYGNSYTNLLTYSEQFDHAVWIESGGTITENVTIAPDGTPTADKVESAAPSYDGVYQNITALGLDLNCVFSFYAKADTVNKVSIGLLDTSDNSIDRLTYNFDTRQIEIIGGTPVVYGSEDIVDGWVRLWMKPSSNLTDSQPDWAFIYPGQYNSQTAGDSVFIWGAQLVTGASPGHYVKTEATSASGGCTATGSAGDECYNTRVTCQDAPNYTKHLKTYRCCEKVQGLPAGIPMIPAITGISNAPGRIVNDFGLGHRASISIAFDDHPHHDRGVDPYVANRSYDPETQGTFWGRFRARNPYYQGRAMRLRAGYMTDPWDWNNFENREYVIEQITGPDSSGRMRMTGKDVLKLADDKRSVCPPASEGELLSDMTVAGTTMSVTGGTYNDPAVTSANEWVRVGSEIIQYTALSGTGAGGDPYVLTGLTRTDLTWGSTNDTHDAGDAVQQCKAWESVNVRDIIDELLVTYASISSTYIVAADWDTEESQWLSGYNLTAICHEPTGVSELIAELQEQCQLRIWWDEVAQEIKLKTLTPPIGNVPTVLDDTSNVLADSVKVKDDAKDRISEVWIYYDLKDYTEDSTKDFQKLYIQIDSDAENSDQYGDTRIHVIKSRWFDENNASVAAQTASRLLSTRRDAPRTIRFSMDAKDAAGTKTGDVRDLEVDDIQGADGALETTRVLITQTKEAEYGHRFDYIGLTGIGTSRFGFIGPNSLLDYTAEIEANQLSYAFICDSTTLKMSNGDDSYKII